VVHGDTVVGCLVAGREILPIAYMIPIGLIFDDIASRLGESEVKICENNTFGQRTTEPSKIPGQESAPESRGDNFAISQPRKAPAQALEYEYEALPDGQSIRMLTLYPGAPDDPLVGKLEFFNIACRDNYESLSYVWGKPERRYEIICEGKRIGLTTSLHDALRRLRQRNRPRRLWADQICINQKNEEERSQQVQFMNHIYKNASHVLVWLGPDDKAMAKPAFKQVRVLDEIFQDEEKREKFSIEHTDHLEKCSKAPWIPLTHITHLPWVSWAGAISSPRNTNAFADIYISYSSSPARG
jgi:hypothetical protein